VICFNFTARIFIQILIIINRTFSVSKIDNLTRGVKLRLHNCYIRGKKKHYMYYIEAILGFKFSNFPILEVHFLY